MSRPRLMLTYGLWTAGLVAMFTLFIAVRNDTALVGALSAAGTVAAGVFAAIAALGSMRAAAESSASARQSREAVARTVRPRVRPSITPANGSLLGMVQCDGHVAVDVTVTWFLTNGDSVMDRVARLEPRRPGLPPGFPTSSTVDLRLGDTASPADEIKMVWIQYWDDGRLGQWQDTWRVGTEAPNQGTFVQMDSRLVD